MKKEGRKIVALTAYDYLSARLLDDAGVDVILVGDSLGWVIFGMDTTVSVTLEQILHHLAAVRPAVRHAVLWADLPLVSLKKGVKRAVADAKRLVKHGADAVKVEGGAERAALVKAMGRAGVPAVGHVGLTPQFADQLGGMRLQGKTAREALKISGGAFALEKAGVTAVVMEVVPDRLARYLTDRLAVPTVGIGAGKWCDGQIMVQQDMLGIYWEVTGKKPPRFLKQYASLARTIGGAFERYSQQVRRGRYPARKQTFRLKNETWREIEKVLAANAVKGRSGGGAKRR